MDGTVKIKTCEMHCGGEPLRIVESGLPAIPGDTLLEKRRNMKASFDQYRQLLMLEPRGHRDMYGCLLLPAADPRADYSVLFMHNEGYSTMCGHATICLGRYIVEKIWNSDIPDGETRVVIEYPCGLVELFVKHSVDTLESGRVRFISVPAFPYKTDLTADVPNIGRINFDISFGGAYYAIVPSVQCGVEFGSTSIWTIISIAMAIKTYLMEQVPIKHPSTPDLEFLYGVILVDDRHLSDSRQSTNLTVFANGQVDRSPTGSGVTARMALLYKKDQVKLNEPIEFISAANGSMFTGKVISNETLSDETVKVEVSGKAFFTGTCEFVVEKDDPFGHGFMAC